MDSVTPLHKEQMYRDVELSGRGSRVRRGWRTNEMEGEGGSSSWAHMAGQGTPMKGGPGTSYCMSCASKEPKKVHRTKNRWMAERRSGRKPGAHRITAQAIAAG